MLWDWSEAPQLGISNEHSMSFHVEIRKTSGPRAQLFKANDVVNDSLKFTSSDAQIC